MLTEKDQYRGDLLGVSFRIDEGWILVFLIANREFVEF